MLLQTKMHHGLASNLFEAPFKKNIYWMNHETDIQPKQIETQTQIRVSRSNENGRRTQSHSPSPSSRQKSPGRLKKRIEFQSVKKSGERLVGRFVCIDRKKGPELRFGITASGRFGNSPERNRFKRLVREAFRTSGHLMPQNIEVHVLPRQKAKGAKMQQIRDELLHLLS